MHVTGSIRWTFVGVRGLRHTSGVVRMKSAGVLHGKHASGKALTSQVRDAEPDGEVYDAKVKVMSEYVKHHVKEEQNEMFPKARKTKLDLNELGARLAERKQQLLGEKGAAPSSYFQRAVELVSSL